jgi:hypothetical protein
LENKDDIKMSMDSDAVLDALEKMYPPDKYAFFRELRIGGGFAKDSQVSRIIRLVLKLRSQKAILN